MVESRLRVARGASLAGVAGGRRWRASLAGIAGESSGNIGLEAQNREIPRSCIGPPPCAPANGRPGFPFGFLGASGRLPKARRGRVFIVQFFFFSRSCTQKLPGWQLTAQLTGIGSERPRAAVRKKRPFALYCHNTAGALPAWVSLWTTYNPTGTSPPPPLPSLQRSVTSRCASAQSTSRMLQWRLRR